MLLSPMFARQCSGIRLMRVTISHAAALTSRPRKVDESRRIYHVLAPRRTFYKLLGQRRTIQLDQALHYDFPLSTSLLPIRWFSLYAHVIMLFGYILLCLINAGTHSRPIALTLASLFLERSIASSFSTAEELLKHFLDGISPLPVSKFIQVSMDGPNVTMLQAIERYMKQAIVDRNASVSSAALVSSLHLTRIANDVVKRWVNEAQEAINSDSTMSLCVYSVMVQYHALGVLYHIRKSDRLAVTKLVAKLTRTSLKSPYAVCMLVSINLCWSDILHYTIIHVLHSTTPSSMCYIPLHHSPCVTFHYTIIHVLHSTTPSSTCYIPLHHRPRVTFHYTIVHVLHSTTPSSTCYIPLHHRPRVTFHYTIGHVLHSTTPSTTCYIPLHHRPRVTFHYTIIHIAVDVVQIRIACKLLEDEDSMGAGSPDSPLFEFIESCLRHKSEMVIYEAAHAIVNLRRTTARELAPAVSVLQLFCSSPKPTLRFAAVRTLNKVAMSHPAAVTACNLDLENLITDSNRSIATLAITTLLKTGAESSVDRLMKQIASFVSEISDEFKIVVVQAIRALCLKFPRKHSVLMNFLSAMLRDEGGLEYKASIADTIITIIEENPEAKETGLAHLCEFIEDCEHTSLAVRILHLLGKEGPRTKQPSSSSLKYNASPTTFNHFNQMSHFRYIRFIYNRVILENAAVRAAAVAAMAQFGAMCPDLLPNIQVLLARCQMDTDDEVRDRATYYYSILDTNDKSLSNHYIVEDSGVLTTGPDTGVLTTGPDTGVLTTGPDTGVLTTGSDTGVLTTGPDTGVLTTGPDTGVLTTISGKSVTTTGPDTGVLTTMSGKSVITTGPDTGVLITMSGKSVITTGSDTGVLSTGPDTGVLITMSGKSVITTGSNTGVLTTGPDTGVLTTNVRQVFLPQCQASVLTTGPDTGVLITMSGKSVLTTGSDTGVLTTGPDTGVLTTGPDTGVLTTMSGKSVLTTGSDTGVLTTMSGKSVITIGSDTGVLTTGPDTGVLTTMSGKSVITTGSDTGVLTTMIRQECYYQSVLYVQVSIPGLERALHQYTLSPAETPFDMKSVPLATVPSLTEETSAALKSGAGTEGIFTSISLADPVLGTPLCAAGNKSVTVSREESYGEKLRAVAELASLGPLFRSSEPVELTESETEYVVRCVKHSFTEHLVLQFDCLNTLNDQLLENVRVVLEPAEGYQMVQEIPCSKLPYNETGTTYIVLKYPEELGATVATFSAMLNFVVKDCDPTTGLPDSDDGYDDEYIVSKLIW
uniref:Coatomer subunit gamma n=2 Tax=Timema TaxID=61471 RepID=A0A7R9F1A6_9NEOP|nr:unnamed protein product [Timema bartmani]